MELEVAPALLPRLLRAPVLLEGRIGRARTTAIRRVWHDTADGALRGRGLALSEASGVWRLERLVPNGSADWPPAAPAPVLAEASSPASALGILPGSPLVPVAAFTGRQKRVELQAGQIELLEGALRGVAADDAACRVRLSGDQAFVVAAAESLAGPYGLVVPRAGLAAQALSVASGQPAPPRHLGTAAVPEGADVQTGLALVTGHLTDVILYWAPLAVQGATPEPVHQMRVAVRRLRSALTVFRRACAGDVGDDALRDAGRDLKELAARLGAARDWDVFLGGTGAEVSEAFAGDRRITALMAAAERKRRDAYAALASHLAGEAWRRTALRLALLTVTRPWAVASPEPDGEAIATARLTAPAAAYAAQALNRLLKHVVGPGEDLAGLPAEALHAVRKEAKQLRYACEFFAPLFPAKGVRRFLTRLEDLQEALGAVNDAHVAAALMAALGGGAERGFAVGAVQGWVAARSAPGARQAVKAWRRFLDQAPFWD